MRLIVNPHAEFITTPDQSGLLKRNTKELAFKTTGVREHRQFKNSFKTMISDWFPNGCHSYKATYVSRKVSTIFKAVNVPTRSELVIGIHHRAVPLQWRIRDWVEILSISCSFWGKSTKSYAGAPLLFSKSRGPTTMKSKRLTLTGPLWDIALDP